VSREPEELLIPGDRFALVNQHAHTYAAIGSPQERVRDQNARFVAAENVVLKIQRSLGRVDHFQAQQESVDTDIEDAKSAESGILSRGARELSAEAGRLRIGQGNRGSLRIVRAGRQRRATPESRQDERDAGRKAA
jgi:hypothetical protein